MTALDKGFPFDIDADPQQRAGVWSNAVEIVRGDDEFTLDFVRADFSERPPTRGVLVARVAISARLLSELGDRLHAAWIDYAEDALPQEVKEHDEPSDADSGRESR